MMTKLERIPKGSTIRTAEGRRSIRAIMEGLEGGPDVTKGEFGQEAGTKPRINRRKPGNMGSGEELEGRIRAQAESRARRDKKPLTKSVLAKTSSKHVWLKNVKNVTAVVAKKLKIPSLSSELTLPSSFLFSQ